MRCAGGRRRCVCVLRDYEIFRYRVINTGNPRTDITNNANHFKHLYPHCCVIGFLTLPEMVVISFRVYHAEFNEVLSSFISI